MPITLPRNLLLSGSNDVFDCLCKPYFPDRSQLRIPKKVKPEQSVVSILKQSKTNDLQIYEKVDDNELHSNGVY